MTNLDTYHKRRKEVTQALKENESVVHDTLLSLWVFMAFSGGPRLDRQDLLLPEAVGLPPLSDPFWRPLYTTTEAP